MNTMPSGSYAAASVRCPFFKGDNGQQRITCEGLVDDSSIALIYRRKADYEVQMHTFCQNKYKNCEIYRMLMEMKYEEDG